ncbi:hypothetical protein UMM65_01430 [Aureibaculum sp. 2210JD6-5]|uniref:hypothetical protein n=1 Tax=Aureibaculum sp. 2210JD6-5 TaxID=3103957 RepID=UPI002AAD0F44|nr:hypothetical protein [Aureibaculum sp. 2210JD6-5]MDY7393893.1 hypothetical protein [Aureibaculum sp. 2210JD6-5]
MDNSSIDIPVTDLIPQKAPIVMVDTLLRYSDAEVTSKLTITDFNIFTKNNIFTEPGLIEHMAQTVALHTGYKYYLQNKPSPTGYIGSIKSVEIVNLPKLNDTLITTASILHEIMGVTLVAVDVTLNGKSIATGEMKTVVAK